MDIKDKKIIVTGGCSGIGKSITEKFLSLGGTVFATYNSSQLSATEMLKTAEKNGFNLFCVKMDSTNEKDIEEKITLACEKMSGVDILVNNVGVNDDKLFFMMDDDSWNKVLNVNINGTYAAIKAVLLNMLERKKGSIVNISSVSGLVGIAGQTNYCASKSAIIGLTKALSKELAYKNIRVNAVAPGYIDTEMTKKIPQKKTGRNFEFHTYETLRKTRRSRFVSRFPVKRRIVLYYRANIRYRRRFDLKILQKITV